MATKEPQDGKKPNAETPEELAEAKAHAVQDQTPGHSSCCIGKRPLEVTLRARPSVDTEHAELNSLIRFQIVATSFPEYKKFMDQLVGPPVPPGVSLTDEMARVASEELGLGQPELRKQFFSGTGAKNPFRIHGTIPYELLRLATEVWLLTRCGPACWDFDIERCDDDLASFVKTDASRLGISGSTLKTRILDYLDAYVSPDSPAATPYLNLIVEQLLPTLPPADKLGYAYRSRWECPSMIELIWSYWHEEGGQCQTMNAIALRFQNRKSRPGRDPLANLATDPLRPMQSLLWGWVESAYKRLTVERRAYEYDNHYGLTLLGKAVPTLMSADSRSKFLEGFHSLLHIAHLYYVERADTTRIPDGFPLLNALRNVHLILAEGAHNQYGDLPWTSRVEMLIEQWLIARPEMREFLRGRAMVPYHEGWMGQVDTMKKLQGWSDVTITHYHELATTGEAILLAVRHGPWATTNDQEEAKTWADYWRPELQRYIYAYKAVTGADLTVKPISTVMPARLLQARLAKQQAAMGLR